MTEGLTRRRAAGASPALPSSSTIESPASPPSRSKPPVEGGVEGRGKVAYDPRDFENGGEAEQMPRLTIMEEVLLLGLKDKAVGLTGGRADVRDTCHFGTTTSRTPFEGVYSSNLPCADGLPWSATHRDADLHSQTG